MLKCELCGNAHNVVLGENTLFSEYAVICEDCLNRAMAQEFAPSPLEVAQNKLEEMALSDEMIYGFTVEETAVIIEWFDGGKVVKTVLADCNDNEEAIDVLCELC